MTTKLPAAEIWALFVAAMDAFEAAGNNRSDFDYEEVWAAKNGYAYDDESLIGRTWDEFNGPSHMHNVALADAQNFAEFVADGPVAIVEGPDDGLYSVLPLEDALESGLLCED